MKFDEEITEINENIENAEFGGQKDGEAPSETLPLIALRGMVAFPKIEFVIDIKRDISTNAISEGMKRNDRTVIIVTQKDKFKEDIVPSDLYGIGITARIKQLYKIAPGAERAVVSGLSRVEVLNPENNGLYFTAGYRVLKEKSTSPEERELATGLLRNVFNDYSRYLRGLNPEFRDEIMRLESPGFLADVLAARLELKTKNKQKLLETLSVGERADSLAEILISETEVMKIRREIDIRVRENMSKYQREGVLREQLKVISDELKELDGAGSETAGYRAKAEKLKLTDEAKEKLEEELLRLEKMPPMTAEGAVCRDYIELLLSLPWGVYSEVNTSLSEAEEILEEDHWGLEDVKERVVEYLALKLGCDNPNAPVLCLVGPPGVGKTSVARSVARALGIKYVRMSLGGLHDEAELRGHRKTYIGAMPGRIINAIKTAGTSNPLILMDEIDKVGSDYKGDPASALLEILDGEQNFSFRDNYLELPYDISRVLFICTANTVDTIPAALRDRMEIINIGSYTEDEKINIAEKYLVKKQMDFHGLKPEKLRLKPEVIPAVIEGYTKEAGVRGLEKQIGRICRKALKELMTDSSKESITVDSKKLKEYLGSPKIKQDKIADENRVGEVTGLAWTSVGGTVLRIEANIYKGGGGLKLTGNAGKIMEESAQAAYSFIRANAKKMGIEADFEKTDIHLHIPEGAVPKDGPSAGITMAAAMASALTGKPIRRDAAMTGEITIRGSVLPIGGLKEKLLAAKNVGVRRVVLPMDNSADVEELEDYIKENLEFVFVEHAEEALCAVFAEEAESFGYNKNISPETAVRAPAPGFMRKDGYIRSNI